MHHENEASEEYFLAIRNDSVQSGCDDEELKHPVRFQCFPEYTYYDCHCIGFRSFMSIGFPIVPPECGKGIYCGQQYYVFEKLYRCLRVITQDTEYVRSRKEIALVALQLLKIVYELWTRSRVLKSIHVDDFYLRKTTKGFRIFLTNQYFSDE